MDEEIVLDRGNTTVMKLDADEQALMDEVEISMPRPRPVPRPTSACVPPLNLSNTKRRWMLL
jgi:hypothetical protein